MGCLSFKRCWALIGDSAKTENVSWKPGFREDLMDYEHIGLTPEFPAEFGERPPKTAP